LSRPSHLLCPVIKATDARKKLGEAAPHLERGRTRELFRLPSSFLLGILPAAALDFVSFLLSLSSQLLYWPFFPTDFSVSANGRSDKSVRWMKFSQQSDLQEPAMSTLREAAVAAEKGGEAIASTGQ
jgi:hypothetical protein